MPDKWAQYVVPANPGPPADKWAQYAVSNSATPPASTMASANPPTATITAGTPEPWLNQVEDDLRGGGSRTFIGRGLGYLQGRGNQGYTGLEAGQGPGVADFMGSIPLGATHFAQGAVEDNPGKAFLGAAQMATIPSAFMGGPALEAGAEAIPSKAYAGHLFDQVMQAAGDQPVALTRTGPQLEKMLQLGREGGGTVPLPARQLANVGGQAPPKSIPILRQMQNDLTGATAATEAPKPLPYSSARNFQSGLSSLSREDTGNMGGPMKAQLKQVNKSLYGDIYDAVSPVGQGANYAQAMKENAQAERLKQIIQMSRDQIARYRIPAAVGGAGYSLYKGLRGK